MTLTARAAEEPAGRISLVGVDPALWSDGCAADLVLERLGEAGELFRHMESGGEPVDAVVLGLAPEDAVRVAQRIHTYDKLIPVLILSPPAAARELQRTLMFSPFLGNEVAAWSEDDLDILPAMLRQAVSRRRQRLLHRNTLATAQIRLEKLPLQQPEATHYLDQLLDHAPVGVVTVDLAGTVVTLNRRAQDILATAGHRVLGQPLERFFPDGERARLAAFRGTASTDQGAHSSEVFALHRAPGEVLHVEVTLAPLAYRTGQRGFMLILQDVTSRIEAEQERRRAEAELRHHVSVLRRFHEITSAESLSLDEKLGEVLSLGCEQFALPTGMLTRVEGADLRVLRAVGNDSGFLAGSRHRLERTYCGISLLSSEPLALAHASSEDWQDHPAYQSTGLQAYIGTRIQGDGGVNGTLCFFSSAPRERPFSSADNELLKLMSRWVGSELQRERADALMRKLSGALEQTADAVMITDRERRIEYVNPSFETLTGYAKRDVLGHKTYFLRSGLHDDKFYDELWQVIGSGGVYRGTLVNRKKDGSLYHEQKTITPLKDADGKVTHFISTGHDITELIEAEERSRAHQAELAHVARLTTLGEMTSGLAHELNQPLCAITTYAQACLHILQNGDCKPDQVRYGLEQVVKQAELAGAIFRRLRDFARKGEIRREAIGMAQVIREVMCFVNAEAQQKLVKLHLEVPADLPVVWADAIQIEQVLLNLVRNAMDAVVGLEEARRQIHIKALPQPRAWVTVEIRDNGGGCPPDMKDRLFEPFVTSKPDGLGIGLSISQGIVEAHGGRLWLAGNSPEGAVFRFTLPSESATDEDERH